MKSISSGFVILVIIAMGCKNDAAPNEEKLDSVETEVISTLQQYHADIEREGILAELDYLDTTDQFSWFAPGYSGPIGYDSVVTILRAMAPMYSRIDHTWDSLKVIPETMDKARYIGYVTSVMTDTLGLPRQYRFKEDGIIVRRDGHWKLQSGKTIEVQ